MAAARLRRTVEARAERESDDYAPSDVGDLVEGCRRLQEWIAVLLDGLPAVEMRDVARDPFLFVGRAIAVRQNAALQAAVVLASADLGHTALPMVRPACAELIWATYLGNLTPDQRRRLITAWNGVESGRTVLSQAN